ncbi:MAG: hypothetical protein LBR54_03870 [Oscillospiraceae bacterium]|nr:hypothetical protein [Oscillospiraceae bacterium]
MGEIAPLFGMDGNIAASGYEDLDRMEHGNPNIEMLYLKSAKSKPKSLTAVFKEVFGEALEPLGFRKIKGRQPYFVRVVPGGEIIHVITYRSEQCFEFGFKAFDILGGVATVYRQSIDLTWTPSDNLNWLIGNAECYAYSNPTNFDNEFRISLFNFQYKSYDAESMAEAIEYSLETTKKFMLPVFDKATTLDACVDYFYKFKLPRSFYYDKETFGNDNPNNYCEEGLLLTKVCNADSFFKITEKYLKRDHAVDTYNMIIGIGRYSQETLEERRKLIKDTAPQRMKCCEELFNNYEWINKANEELERRKTANTETLRSYGLDL